MFLMEVIVHAVPVVVNTSPNRFKCNIRIELFVPNWMYFDFNIAYVLGNKWSLNTYVYPPTRCFSLFLLSVTGKTKIALIHVISKLIFGFVPRFLALFHGMKL